MSRMPVRFLRALACISSLAPWSLVMQGASSISMELSHSKLWPSHRSSYIKVEQEHMKNDVPCLILL